MNEEILKLAKECRAFHYPDGATVFPINTLEAFYKAAYNAGLEAAAKAVKGMEVEIDQKWTEQRKAKLRAELAALDA